MLNEDTRANNKFDTHIVGIFITHRHKPQTVVTSRGKIRNMQSGMGFFGALTPHFQQIFSNNFKDKIRSTHNVVAKIFIFTLLLDSCENSNLTGSVKLPMTCKILVEHLHTRCMKNFLVHEVLYHQGMPYNFSSHFTKLHSVTLLDGSEYG